MIDPKLALVMIVAGCLYFAGIGIWHGVQKVGHGAKVVACKTHLAHCEKDVAKKQSKP